jgi:hypothetical protein
LEQSFNTTVLFSNGFLRIRRARYCDYLLMRGSPVNVARGGDRERYALPTQYIYLNGLDVQISPGLFAMFGTCGDAVRMHPARMSQDGRRRVKNHSSYLRGSGNTSEPLSNTGLVGQDRLDCHSSDIAYPRGLSLCFSLTLVLASCRTDLGSLENCCMLRD